MSLKSLDMDDNEIEVSVKFCRIGEIDIMNEKFFAEFKLYISWMTREEIVDKYDAKKYWNPKIVIENAFAKSDEQVEYKLTKYSDKTSVLETRHIKVSRKNFSLKNNWIWNCRLWKGFFWERFELQHFPFDAQELSITLMPKIKDKKLRIVAKDFQFKQNAKAIFLEQQRYELLNQVEHSHIAFHVLY